jgi:hypothetical protein
MGNSQHSCGGMRDCLARAAAFWLRARYVCADACPPNQAMKTFYSEHHNLRCCPYAFLMGRRVLFN